MSYGTHTFWDIYSYTLHPVCGSVVVVIACVVFIAGIQDDRARRLFWVATILGISMLGFFVGEWSEGNRWVNRFENMDPPGGAYMRRDFGMALIQLELWKRQAQMMFMAQAGLAVTFALALLWWPILSKEN